MKGTEFFNIAAAEKPFSNLHPSIGSFFRTYLSKEKITRFNGRYVVNTHFPPFPGRSFNALVEHFNRIGDTEDRSLFSVTFAVTNRCPYNCWHCYNAGRSQSDIELSEVRRIVKTIQDMGAVKVTISGGEPLLRNDLEKIVGAFDDRTNLVLNTTGFGLTGKRAAALRDNGLFGFGVSLDSTVPEEHDRLRGRKRAFETALEALGIASDNGLYTYVIAVATADFLRPERFWKYVEFVNNIGVQEIHLLEPCPAGKLQGDSGIVLGADEKKQILEYQEEISSDDDLPIFSSFLYLESPEAFGCGAGITHLYVDGSGEVSPCNLVPLSFGNITREPLDTILDRMGGHFRRPRQHCVGIELASFITDDKLPLDPAASEEICRRYLPVDHDVPAFFRIKESALGSVGGEELRSAYDRVHDFYDDFWVVEAGKPVADIVSRLPLEGGEKILEAGCGTGFATSLLAKKAGVGAHITAVDISDGMLDSAGKRLLSDGIETVRLVRGDALDILGKEGPFDIVFSSWVLGYIPPEPFFRAAFDALETGGYLAFIVHKENSPALELGIFEEIVVQDPSVLLKRVFFDFPRDSEHTASMLKSSGFNIENISEGSAVFTYDSAERVLEHLLKSGAGTAFYDAVDPERCNELEKRFISVRNQRNQGAAAFEVVHDYVACIARKH